MVRKKMKKWIAFALAAVVTATSVMPATLQNVYAETVMDPGNPFGQNVAKNKTVTVLNQDGEVDSDPGLATTLPMLVNGEVEPGNIFEKGYLYDDGKYKLELVVDLRGEYLIDSVSIHWRNLTAAREYQVLTSTDNETWELASVERIQEFIGNGDDATLVKSAFRERKARYVKIFCKEHRDYNVFSPKEIEVWTVGTVEEETSPNYALGKPAYASVNNEAAGKLTDGKSGAADVRWMTGNDVMNKEDAPESVYCYVDLEGIRTLNKINANFTDAYAKKYVIMTATDEAAIESANINSEDYWTVIKESAENTEKNISISYDSGNEIQARYIKVIMSDPSVPLWGFEIEELEAKYEREQLSVEKILLSRTDAYAFSEVGATLQLYAQAVPKNAADAEITWSSNRESVATVSENGLVTAIGEGMATITATVGDISNSVNVTLADKLADPTVEAQAIKQEDGTDAIQVSWSMPEGAGDDIKYILRRKRDDEPLTFLKSISEEYTETTFLDTKVLPGRTYQYYVKAYQGTEAALEAASEWSESAPVTITLALTGLAMNQTEATLGIQNGKADTLQLRVTKDPAAATDKIIWESDNDSVATVTQNGYVTAQGAGTANITAKAEGSELSATCSVRVMQQLATPEVKAEKTGADEIKLSWNKVANVATYQIYRAKGRDVAEKDFELLEITAEDIDDAGTTVGYTDSIDTTKVMGNHYSYKVAAVPADDSDYILGEKSLATEPIAIGQVNPFGTNIALGKKVTTTAEMGPGSAELDILTDGVVEEAPHWESDTAQGGNSESNEPQAVDVTFDVDLGEIYNINKVKIYWRGITRATEYTISVLPEGGTDYVQVGDNTTAREDGRVMECPFTYQRARYVRISVTKTAGFAKCGVNEIEVYTPGTVTMEDTTLTRILLSQRTARMSVGDNLDLYVQKLPANAAENITWTALEGHGEETTGTESTLVKLESYPEEDGCKVTALAPGILTVWAHAHEADATNDTADEHHRNCKIVITGKLAKPIVSASIEPTEEKSINVSWDAIDHAEKYNLYRMVGEEPAEEKAELIAKGLTATTYEDKDVEVGEYYSYQVVAVNESEKIPEIEPAEKLYEDSEKSEATEPVPVPIHVESISLDKSKETLTLLPGEDAAKPTLQLKAANNPANATFGFTWESSNENVATVNENGLVTAVGIGTTTITATTKDEKSSASSVKCEITVKEQLAAPEVTTAIADDEKSIMVSVDAVANAVSYKLEKSVDNGTYTEIADADLTPDSSYKDEDVEPGKTYKYRVTAVPAADAGYVESDFAETEGERIPVRITKINLDETEYVMGTNEELNLGEKVEIEPKNVDDDLKELVWEATAGEAVEVDSNGLVTAKEVGTAKIAVKPKDPRSAAVSTICTILVRERLAAPEVTAAQSADKSSITISWNVVENAASYELWKTTDEGEAVKLDISELQPTDAGKLAYTDAVEKGHTYTYKVVAMPESGSEAYIENEGSADPVKVKGDLSTPTGVNAAAAGQNVTVTWTAVEHAVGYIIQRSTNGTTFVDQPMITGAKYEDKNLAAGTYYYKVIAKGNDDYDDSAASSVVTATITVTEQPSTKYTVTFNSDGGTSVAAQTVESGKTATMPTAPTKSGYKFAGWYNGATAYNFSTPVTSNLTLTAKWTANGNQGTNQVKVSKITITGMSKKIAAGKKITLKANVTPANAANKTVKWTTSNKKYATVNAKGVVTTKKAGVGKTVTVTATAQDGSNRKATYKITLMNKAVKKVKLTAKTKTVKAGKKLTVKAAVTLSGKIDKKSKSTKSNKTVAWKSSNKKYATVSNKGVVKANKAGKGKTVTITATATDGSGKKATIKIKISK